MRPDLVAEPPEGSEPLDCIHPHPRVEVLHLGDHETVHLVGNLDGAYEDHGGWRDKKRVEKPRGSQRQLKDDDDAKERMMGFIRYDWKKRMKGFPVPCVSESPFLPQTRFIIPKHGLELNASQIQNNLTLPS